MGFKLYFASRKITIGLFYADQATFANISAQGDADISSDITAILNGQGTGAPAVIDGCIAVKNLLEPYGDCNQETQGYMCEVPALGTVIDLMSSR